MDVNALITKVGSAAKLADLVGVSHGTVRGWRAAGFIPATRVPQISALLDIPASELFEAARKPRTAPSQRESA